MEKFINECKNLLQTPIDKEEANNTKLKNKAKLWCVTYETVEDKLSGKKLEEVNESKKNEWKTKYDTATADSNGSSFKETIKKFGDSNGSDTANKKKKAMHKWCEVAMDASKDTIKTEVETHCLLEESGG